MAEDGRIFIRDKEDKEKNENPQAKKQKKDETQRGTRQKYNIRNCWSKRRIHDMKVRRKAYNH